MSELKLIYDIAFIACKGINSLGASDFLMAHFMLQFRLISVYPMSMHDI